MAAQRTIGRLAREAGVGVETIRFYERRGLLKQPRRPADGGHRHYEDRAVVVLRYIRLAQSLGLSLKDIEALLVRTQDPQSGFCRAVRETVDAKLAAVRAELAALNAREAELQKFLDSCAARAADLPCPILAGLAAAAPGAGPQSSSSGSRAPEALRILGSSPERRIRSKTALLS